jgi:L-iditol 2-dehydrogenase
MKQSIVILILFDCKCFYIKIDKFMNAAVFYGPNNIRIENVNIKKRNSNDYLLKVLSCSVCSYDTRVYRNGHFKVIPPIILGHEICAQIIEEYHDKNINIKPGSRVSIYPVIPCRNCWYCKYKKYNLCTNLKEIGSSINGGFAEYLLIPKTIFEIGGIIPIPDNITNEEASLIEPLACCINSINQIKNLEFSSVIILGDGPIGLMQLMLIKRSFKVNVIVIGKISHRLDLARKLGADFTILIEMDDNKDNNNDIEGYKKYVKEVNEEFSPNLIFVSNNNPSSLNLALKLVNKNGKIVLFSGIKNQINGNSMLINIDPNFIHYNQVSIFGSFSSTPNDMTEAMNIINFKELNLKSLITNEFSIFKIKDAFFASESYKGFKSTINKF